MAPKNSDRRDAHPPAHVHPPVLGFLTPGLTPQNPTKVEGESNTPPTSLGVLQDRLHRHDLVPELAGRLRRGRLGVRGGSKGVLHIARHAVLCRHVLTGDACDVGAGEQEDSGSGRALQECSVGKAGVQVVGPLRSRWRCLRCGAGRSGGCRWVQMARLRRCAGGFVRLGRAAATLFGLSRLLQ